MSFALAQPNHHIESSPGEQQHNPAAANSAVISIFSGRTHQLQVNIVIHRAQVVLLLGVVVVPGSRLRDLLQQRRVELGVHGEAVHVRSVPAGRPARPRRCARPGRRRPAPLPAGWVGVVLAVGQQHNRGRFFRAGTGAGVGVLSSVLYRRCAGCLVEIEHVERGGHALAERGAALWGQPVDRRQNGALVVRRRLHRKPLSLNATTPMRTVVGWCCTNSRAAALTRLHARGRHVLGGHLPETSKARMTVPSMRGRLIGASGRASAASRIVRPSRNSVGGMARAARRAGCWPAPDPAPKLLIARWRRASSAGRTARPAAQAQTGSALRAR